MLRRSLTITAARPSLAGDLQFIPEPEGGTTTAHRPGRHRHEPPTTGRLAPAAGRAPRQAQFDPIHGGLPRRSQRTIDPCGSQIIIAPPRTSRAWCAMSPAAMVAPLPRSPFRRIWLQQRPRPYDFDPPGGGTSAEAEYRGFNLGLATHDTKTLTTALTQRWAKVGVKPTSPWRVAPPRSRWIASDQHQFLIADPTSIMFDASFQLRVPRIRLTRGSRRQSPRARTS